MAGIIKSDGRHLASPTQKAAAFNVEDMQLRAEAYLAEVKQQAAQIINQAQQQATQIRQQAKVDGAEDALAAAKASLKPELDQRLQQLLELIVQVVDEVRQEKDAWLRQWETSAVHLSTAIAERVIRREVSGSVEVSEGLVRESLELAAGCKQISIHLNPADYELLGDNITLISQELANVSPAQIVRNEKVSRGGCLIETEHGSIDQQIETQLARIEEELTA